MTKNVLPEWDTDVNELGERAAEALTQAEFGTLYTYVEDRTWNVVMDCFASIVQAVRAKYDIPAGERVRVPPEWTPRLDEDGMWVHRRRA